MEAIQKAFEEYKQAQKDKAITLAAKLLTQIQALDEAIAKATEARAAFEKQQNEKINENKEVVKQFLADAKKKAAEEKQRMKDEVEALIAQIQPHLDAAEAAYNEKQANATKTFNEALDAIKKSLESCR